jgi:hypothetical protein
VRTQSYAGPPPPDRGAHNLSRVAETILMAAVALALLVPCFWQPHIIAGDVPSHVYNAWLATQVERGQAPGLFLAHPLTNVLSDWALQALLNSMGRAWAERVVIGASVEIFFWGAFVFVAAVAGRRSWLIAPSLGMLAYGLILQLGLLNFYLATGLSLWIMALLWNPRRPWCWLALPLAALTLLAHALPLAWAVAALIYVHAVRRVPEIQRGLVFVGGVCFLVLAQTVLFMVFPAQWSLDSLVNVGGMLGVVGGVQVFLFGMKYLIVVAGLLLIWFVLFLERLDRGELMTDPIVHLWGLSMAALLFFPSELQFPQYRFPLMFVPERVSLFVALLFCAMVAGGRHGRSLTRASSLLAALFFTALYLDVKAYNQVEAEITRLVSELPPGARVVARVWDSASTHLDGLAHVGSGACIEHCFDFANYEPSTGAFRVRVQGPNGVVASERSVVNDIEIGSHVVTPEEAPLYSICAPGGPGPRLVLRKLAAGEKTCLVNLPVAPEF